MRNFWITFSHTAGKRIKSKAFAISTGVMALFIIGIFTLPALIAHLGELDGQETILIKVSDESAYEGEVGEALSGIGNGLRFENISAEEADPSDTGAEENLLIIEGLPGEIEGLYYGGSAGILEEVLEEALQEAEREAAASRLDLTEEEKELLFSEAAVSPGNGEASGTDEDPYWMIYGLVFAIYLTVITFGSMIATEVASEKSSRVMELIVSSVHPVTQMFGKLAGIGAAGFVNISVLAAAAAAGAYLSGGGSLLISAWETVEISLLFYALLFIFLGYLLYGGAAAMLGALVSRAEEVNQAIQPMIFLAMIAFLLSIVALNAPDLAVFRILSYIPFFTPQLLFLRIGMETVPVWEIWLITVLLILSAAAMNIFAARVYKGGVLLYGKFSFREGIRQALRMSGEK